MSAIQICTVDLTIDRNDFEISLEKYVNKWLNNFNEGMKTQIKEMQTKRGSSLAKVMIENDSNDEFYILAELNANGEMVFCNIDLNNVQHGFYSINCSDSSVGTKRDPLVFWDNFFAGLCTDSNHSGSYARIDEDGNAFLIEDGKVDHHVKLGLVSSNGDVYSMADAKKVNNGGDISFSVNVPIKDWLGEHPEVTKAIGKMPIKEKMDYIGKYLISAKLKDEIESDEFIDIFCQAGLIGYSDAQVLSIYKLLM